MLCEWIRACVRVDIRKIGTIIVPNEYEDKNNNIKIQQYEKDFRNLRHSECWKDTYKLVGV